MTIQSVIFHLSILLALAQFALMRVAVTFAAVALLGLIVALLRRALAMPTPAGSVVLITGGSRGLGLAIAARFARRAVRLVLVSRKLDELEQARASLLACSPHLTSADIHVIAADLSNPTECSRVVTQAFLHFGRLDILINNAGIIEVGALAAQSVQAFEQAMQVNYFAAFYMIWSALPRLRQQTPLRGSRRAAIVNIASIGGKIAVPHMLPYTTAKFALVGLSQGLHAELRGAGIRVTTVCPGLMRTGGEAHAQFVGDVPAEKRWFMTAAKAPLLSTSVAHAAAVIVRSVEQGRAETSVTLVSWLAARFGGLFPGVLQFANAETNQLLLPAAPSSSQEDRHGTP